jgi:hypothetical protein
MVLSCKVSNQNFSSKILTISQILRFHNSDVVNNFYVELLYISMGSTCSKLKSPPYEQASDMGKTLKIQNKIKVSCMFGTIVMTNVDCP